MPLFDIFWMFAMIALFFAWLMLVFRVFADLIRSTDLGGWAKAVWALFVIVLPLFGVLAYVLARGDGMTRRDIEDAYRLSTGTGSMASDIRSEGSAARIQTQGY